LPDDGDPKTGSIVSAPLSVEFRGVTKAYGNNPVLRGIDLEVPTGQRVALIGRSGSGKTTLLRLLMTIERPDSGVINVEGEPLGWREINGKVVWQNSASLRKVRGKIGMVFQHFNLFPHMTVLDNITLAPRRVHRRSAGAAEAAAMVLLERVGLREKAREYPDRLSGGQQQRVAIVRALASTPRLLLLDEVTSALDPELVGEVLDLIRDLKSDGMTMLIATHEMAFAHRVADRICFLDNGSIVESGPPTEVLDAPRLPRTRQFLQRVTKAGRG
jgi:polar amino acid transport system ATP-binding protein